MMTKEQRLQMQAATCGTTQLRLLNLLFGAISLPLLYAAHRQLHAACGAGRSLGMVSPPCVQTQQCARCFGAEVAYGHLDVVLPCTAVTPYGHVIHVLALVSYMTPAACAIGVGAGVVSAALFLPVPVLH
jgi:hypothetical protein